MENTENMITDNQNNFIENDKSNQVKQFKLEFVGEGIDFFKILIVNFILTVLTLGFYYPWAKAKKIKFLYSNTLLDNNTFNFSGTGKEIFKGFIKFIIIYFILFIIISIFSSLKLHLIGIIILYIVIIGIIPFVIHGSLRYRMSRSSYRGVKFGYRGDRRKLVNNFYFMFFLTIITFGIYYAWMKAKLINYTHNNIRYGDSKFESTFNGKEWFILNLKGILLTYLTLGIYSFWYHKDVLNYYVNSISISKDNNRIKLSSNFTAGLIFELIIINFFMIIFTLGIAYAWVEVRTRKILFSNIIISGDIDLDSINQTEDNYDNALGEETFDFLDIDII